MLTQAANGVSKRAISILQPDITDSTQLRNLLHDTNTFQRVILVRHGESLWNAQKRFQGRIDIPLSKIGREQAQQLAIFLRNAPIESAFSSCLSRALETAQIIVKQHPEVVLTKLNLLQEMHQGEWQGKQEHEVSSYQLKLWQEQPLLAYKANAETIPALIMRVLPVWQEILLSSRRTTLIVAHEWTNRAILCHALQVPLEDCVRFPQSNCGVTVLDYPNGVQQPAILRALNIVV